MARYAGRLEGFPDWQEEIKELEANGTKDSASLIEAFNKQDEALRELFKKSDELGDDEIVGTVLSFGVADGSANYVVVKERPLTLAWAPIPDNYQIPAAHLRGITKQDVLEQKRFSKIFS